MAKEKVLPGSGVGFLDLFSTPTLGETEFQQGVKFRVATNTRGFNKYGTYTTQRGRVFNIGKKYLCFMRGA